MDETLRQIVKKQLLQRAVLAKELIKIQKHIYDLERTSVALIRQEGYDVETITNILKDIYEEIAHERPSLFERTEAQTTLNKVNNECD